jgi:tetratricopeptide (TPR) repeat protein
MSANKPMQIGARLEGQRSAGPALGSGPNARNHLNDVPSLLELGSDLYQAGRLSEAERVFRHILKIQSDQFESLQLLAVISGQQGKHAQALDYIDTALRTNADSAAAHNIRGNVLAAQKRFDEAAASFEAAIALEPDSPISLTNLGNALHELRRFDGAIAVYDRALAIDPDDAEACYNRACALQGLQRLDEAVAGYDRAIALRPDQAEAWINRGAALQELERFEPALASYDKAIALKSGSPECWNNRGATLHKLRRFEDAIASYDRALALKPSFPECWNNRGGALRELQRFDDALTSYDKAIALEPRYAEAWRNRGLAFWELGRLEEALASYDEAVALKPDYAEAFNARGNALRELGRLPEALRDFEQAITLAPRHPSSYFNLVTSRRVSAADPHFAALRELAQEVDSLGTEDRIALHFALGNAFDACGDVQQASHHLTRANSLARKQIAYDEAKKLEAFERIRRAFTPELLRSKRGLGDASALPVFIVGMPRSGTTLIEQILASHPQVFGAGELREIDKLAASVRDPHGIVSADATSKISGEQLSQLGAAYVQAVRGLAPQAERITDKMPFNFARAGFIHLVLPNARIIHVRRDPCDTALSCFSLRFTHGQEFTYDLAELGRYYRAYQSVMEHWRRVLPPGVMLEVQYEDVVADLEGQARRIVAHCGLDWDEACLAFHETQRTVHTASVAQVRQPIYQSSVGRWRAYESLMQPFLEALGES